MSNWSINSWPEMQGLNKDEQRRIYQRAYRDVFRGSVMLKACLPMAVLIPIGIFSAQLFIPGMVGTMVGAAIMGGIGGAIFSMILMPHIRQRIAEIRREEALRNPPPVRGR